MTDLMTASEVIKHLNKKGYLVGRPQPDGSMLYGWTVCAREAGILGGI